MFSSSLFFVCPIPAFSNGAKHSELGIAFVIINIYTYRISNYIGLNPPMTSVNLLALAQQTTKIRFIARKGFNSNQQTLLHAP